MRRHGLLGMMVGLGLLGWGQIAGAQDLTPLQMAAQGFLTPETMNNATYDVPQKLDSKIAKRSVGYKRYEEDLQS